MSHEVKEALDGIKNKVDGAVEKIDSKVKAIREDVDDLLQKSVPDYSGNIKTASKSLAKSFKDSEGFRAYKSGATNTGRIDTGMSIKALTSLQGSPEVTPVGIDVLPQQVNGLHGVSFKPVRLYDRLSSLPVDSNAIKFTRLTGFSNAADYQAGEGVGKAEQDLTPSAVTSHIATVAVHHTASKQVLDDESGLVNSLDQLLRACVLEKVESELINGSGTGEAISGLLTEATTFVPTASAKADKIGEAISYMQSEGYMPDVVAISPTDWFEIRSERATGGEYVANGWNQSAAPNIYSVPVVVVPALAANTAMVIDSRFVNILDRQSLTLMASDEHSTNFTQNLVTMLAEIRVGLAVYDLAGVKKLSLGA